MDSVIDRKQRGGYRRRYVATRVFIISMVILASTYSMATADSRVALSWTRGPGGESCPGAAQVTRAIEKHLGRAVFVSPSRAELVVEATVEGTETGLVVRILVSDAFDVEQGRRNLSSVEADCAALVKAVVIAVSILVDSESMTDAPSTVTPHGEKPPTVTDTPTSAPREVTARLPSRSTRSLGTEAAFVVAVSSQTMLGAAVSLRLDYWQWTGIELEGTLFPSFDDELPDGRGARLSVGVAGAHLCPVRFRRSSTVTSACAGFEIGSLQARSFGSDRSHDVEKRLFNAAVTSRISWSLGAGLSLHGGARLVIPTLRPRLEVAELGGTFDNIVRLTPIYAVFEAGIGMSL